MSERVHIVGGGLAGLTVAWELSKVVDGPDIVVYEKLDRVGGKAGSNVREPRPAGPSNGLTPMSDHGYHLFPAWYSNVIRLMSEVGQDYNRVVVHGENFGRAVRAPRLTNQPPAKSKRLEPPASRGGIRRRVPGRPPPPVDTNTLYLRRTPFRHIPFFVLTAAHLAVRSRNKKLEQLSVEGFLEKYHPLTASRSAPMYETLFLKALSALLSETSALSVARFFAYWARSSDALRSASWSSLTGSLQRVLIEPIELALLSRGVRIERGVALTSATYDGRRCTKLEFDGLEPDVGVDADAVVVFAIPPGDIEAAISDRWPIWKPIGALAGMTTQFAGVDVHFDTRLGLPRNHFGFEDQSGRSVPATAYNVAPIWPAREMATPHESVIQIVIPRADASTEDEVKTDVHAILASVDIQCEPDWIHVNLNDEARLSLASVGIHGLVRDINAKAPENVFVAGDYMDSGISVPSMEAAVGSGRRVAYQLSPKLGAPRPSSFKDADADPPRSWIVWILGTCGRVTSFLERVLSLNGLLTSRAGRARS